MTHLDCDHASGLQDFQNTPIYASKEELNFATKKKIRYGKLLEGLNIRTLEFDEDKMLLFSSPVIYIMMDR